MESFLPKSEEGYAQKVYASIASALLVPVFLYSVYALFSLPTMAMFTFVVLGLLSASLGAAATLVCIRTWEQFVRRRAAELVGEGASPVVERVESEPVTLPEEPLPVVPDQRVAELEQEAAAWQEKSEGFEKLVAELREANTRLESSNSELDGKVRASAEASDHKEGLLHDYQQTIAEQRAIIDKKQQYVAKLEAKIEDLQYEVKTLLQLGELGVHSSGEASDQIAHPALDSFSGRTGESGELTSLVDALPASSDRKVYTHYDAAVQLQKSLEVAKKLTGASHLSHGEGSRFRDLSMDSYAIDLRRLFDSLRGDTSATILLYSQKDEKLLFVNNQIKGLLGWTPEKFVKDFPQLIQSSLAEWRHSVQQLGEQREVQARLLTRSRDGREVPVHCYLGVISEGAFASHVIGILYPAETPSVAHSLQ